MTAEQTFEKHWKLKTDHPIDDVIKLNMQYCKDAMIEFATHHVELATQKIKKSIEVDDHFWWTETQIDNLNLLDNIK